MYSLQMTIIFSNDTNYNDCNRKTKFPTVKMYTILRM